VEHIQCALPGLDGELERVARLGVEHRDEEPVDEPIPEEMDVDSVRRPVVQPSEIGGRSGHAGDAPARALPRHPGTAPVHGAFARDTAAENPQPESLSGA
jgi:hypothetical protein